MRTALGLLAALCSLTLQLSTLAHGEPSKSAQTNSSQGAATSACPIQ